MPVVESHGVGDVASWVGASPDARNREQREYGDDFGEHGGPSRDVHRRELGAPCDTIRGSPRGRAVTSTHSPPMP